MTHSSRLLPLPQRDYIHTLADHFSPGGGFVPTAALLSRLKHIPAEMQPGHFTPPQSPSALLRLLKHREGRPSLAIWEFLKCFVFWFLRCQIQTIYALQKLITVAFMKVKSSKESWFLHLAASFNNSNKKMQKSERMYRYGNKGNERMGLKVFNCLIYGSPSSTRFCPCPLRGTLSQIQLPAMRKN